MIFFFLHLRRYEIHHMRLGFVIDVTDFDSIFQKHLRICGLLVDSSIFETSQFNHFNNYKA